MRRVRLGLVWKMALLGALCAGASCGTPTFIVQQYTGPVRARESIAIIRVDGNGTVQLLSLDGEATDARVTPDARLHIEVLPGHHTLWVQSAGGAVPAQAVAFRAEAGKLYRVEFVPAAASGPTAPRIYEADPDSNRLEKDVTVVQPPPDAAPAPAPRTPAPPAPIIVEESTPSSMPVDAGAPDAPGPIDDDAGTQVP